MVWARLIGHTANYDQYASLAYQITVPPITAVALSANPASPQPANTPITLTATPTGGAGADQYLFRVGYTDAAGWHWSNMNGSYTTTATCTWTPTTAGNYTLVVWARLIGHTANYDQYASLPYQITFPPFTAVTLSVNPVSPQPANTAIKLTATPTGGGDQVQYLFRVGYTDSGRLALEQSEYRLHHHRHLYLDAGQWHGTFTLVVWARLIGHTANYDNMPHQQLSVTVPPFTAVAINASPAAPRPINTAITLTATPTGGVAADPISFPRRLLGRRGLALGKYQQHLHHHRHLHLDADGGRDVHAGRVGPPHRPYRELRRIPVDDL